MSEKESTIILATIVHLSDIHFGKPYDSQLGALLLDSIPQHRPDVIVVSGDLADNPRPRWMRAAAGFMEKLRKACKDKSGKEPSLIFVPGNHDYKLLGNISLGFIARTIFKVYFGDWNDGCAIPNFGRRLARYWSVTKHALAATVGRILKPTDASEPQLAGHVLSDGSVVILTYDSNRALLLASGRVSPQQITETPGVLSRLTNRLDPSALRIAVVHHHPVPIPYADKRGLTNVEAFLVLENAGTFMREMVLNDFDLILHGHKHYSNFTRVNYALNPLDSTEIGVLGAGTATVKGGNQRGANSYNVVRVYRHGRTEIELWEYGLSQSRHYAPHAPQPFLLHTADGLKRRAFRRNYNAHQMMVRELIATRKIFPDGRSHASFQLCGLSVGDREIKGYRFGTRTGTGVYREFAIAPETILAGMTFETAESNVSVSDEFEERLKSLRKLSGKLRFNRALGHPDAPLNFSYGYYSVNGYAMSDWEFELLYPRIEDRQGAGGLSLQQPTEHFEQLVWYPLKRLCLRLELPKGITDRPYVEVSFSPEVSKAEDICRDGILTAPETRTPERDGYMRDYEAKQLRLDGENVWVLEIEHPPMGYRYSISWTLPRTKREALPGLLIAESDVYRRLLIGHRHRSMISGGNDNPGVRELLEWLKFLYAIVRMMFPSKDPDEVFDLSLMTYDKSAGRLAVVGGVINGQDATTSYLGFWLPVGVGNAGICYKTGAAHVYVADEAEQRFSYYVPMAASQPHEVLISIPINHPGFKSLYDEWTKKSGTGTSAAAIPDPETILLDRKRQIVAIMNIGSTSSASTLRKLRHETEEEKLEVARRVDELQLICQAGVDHILRRLEHQG
jgi:3',5'-cyclic AMP phosphodiesterase CpdA